MDFSSKGHRDLTGELLLYTILNIQCWIFLAISWRIPMLTRVFVLGLLSFQPMSGYAIQHYLRLNRAEQWAAILPGSIHYALKKLAAEGLVTLQATEQTGYRTKAIYAITAAGMKEFHRLLEKFWSTPEPHYPVGLYAALTFLNALPREKVLAAIDAHIAALQTELEAWNSG